jgi:hypothetical protein
MSKKLIFPSLIAMASFALLLPAEASAAAGKQSSETFRDALYSTCDGKPDHAMGTCMRGRTLVFDMRKADARSKRQACLDGGGTPSQCAAKQEKYWKDLKNMFGL